MPTMPRLTAAERREAGLEAASVEIPKVIFSTRSWPETRIARGDLSEEIARLKREPQKRKAA